MADRDSNADAKPLNKNEVKEGDAKSVALLSRFLGFSLTGMWSLIPWSGFAIVILTLLAFEWGVGLRVITEVFAAGWRLFF